MDSTSGHLLINRHLRSVRFPGFIGGRILGGYSSSPLPAGVGDCALLDFSSGLFAVADGSDRDPSASRHFMVMFAKMLKQCAPAWSLYSVAQVSAMKDALAAESERLLCSMPFGTGCTFTGVVLVRTPGGAAAIVMHTGDSLLITCDINTSHACQFTVDNFWLVGRTQRFFQIEVLPLNDSTRLLLATDGLNGVPFPAGTDRERFILGLFETCSADEVPDRLLEHAGAHVPGRDDVSVIAINPSALVFLPQVLMLGGTGAHEEKLHREERDRGLLDDCYAPVPSSDKALTI